MVGRRSERPCSVWVYDCLTCTAAYGRLLWAAYVCASVLNTSERVLCTCMYCTVGECVCVDVHSSVCVFVCVCVRLCVLQLNVCEGQCSQWRRLYLLPDDSLRLSYLYLIFINTSLSIWTLRKQLLRVQVECSYMKYVFIVFVVL